MRTDRGKAILMLKTCRGQIDATLKMIDEGRYCMDVVNQILAAEALLKKANKLILKQHMGHCVKAAIDEKDSSEKMEEIAAILDKIMR